MAGLFAIARSSGWWWPFAGAVVLTERPCHLARDNQNRLHCETRAAIEYPDGWGVYAWHGTRVPEEWIKNRKTLDPKTALTWENIEQRRAAAEIIGWDRVLSQLDAKVINQNENPQIGTLLEVTLPDAGPQRFLRVTCATGRQFSIPVPNEMKTALEANARTYRKTPSQYQLEART